jgi:hypothetical protein
MRGCSATLSSPTLSSNGERQNFRPAHSTQVAPVATPTFFVDVAQAARKLTVQIAAVQYYPGK